MVTGKSSDPDGYCPFARVIRNDENAVIANPAGMKQSSDEERNLDCHATSGRLAKTG